MRSPLFLTAPGLVSRYAFSSIVSKFFHLDQGKSILAVGLLTCILCFPVLFQSSTKYLVLVWQDGIETYATYAQTPSLEHQKCIPSFGRFCFFRLVYILSCIVSRDRRCVRDVLCLDRVTCSFAAVPCPLPSGHPKILGLGAAFQSWSSVALSGVSCL